VVLLAWCFFPMLGHYPQQKMQFLEGKLVRFMKRLLFGVTILAGAAMLGGCPVYSNDRSCDSQRCYDCPAGSSPSNGVCVPYFCSSANDCPLGDVCDPTGACSVPTGGEDASGCGAGCPTGYLCKLSGGQTQCVPQGAQDAATTFEAAASGSAEAGTDPRRDAGANPFDAADEPLGDAAERPDVASVGEASTADDAFAAVDAASPPDASGKNEAGVGASCNANAACPGRGAKCLDGTCKGEVELCSDTTQCVVAGAACVDGVCTPHCSVTAPCPAGYACDFTRSVCALNPSPCEGSGPSTCEGGTTCVEGRCVAPCAPSEAGSGCPSGQVCVSGGCIADEAVQFSCKNDGQSGLLANLCRDVDVCLHHDCYVECAPDAGGCADPTETCKEVTVGEGTYTVCAARATLGSECDPATGKYCSGGVCIDGYCK
jgi:hypothetical protein